MEQFLHDNSIFIVLTIVAVILAGIFAYMFAIDRKITKLEKTIADELESIDKI